MKQFLGALLLALCLLFAATPLFAATAPVLAAPPAQPASDDVLDRIAAIKAAAEPLRSTFNDDSEGWDADSDDEVQRFFAPGVYHIRVDIPETVAWGVSPDATRDFYAEVDVYQVDGPLDNEFGILFRNDSENYYIFNVSSDGFYRLHKWQDGEWTAIVEWAESAAIVTGEGSHNRLGLLAEGPDLSILVNDVVLASVADETIAGDGLALAVGTFDEGGVEVAFEDFLLWPLGDDAVVRVTPEADTTPEVEVTPEVDTTPEADVTPEPTLPPTLDPELVQTLVEPIRGNEPTYSDDFRRTSERWPTVEDEDGAITFANRGLTIRIDTPNFARWTSNQEIAGLNAADLLVEADVRRDAGAYNATYGLLVRFVDNDNYYYFGISGAGTYSFWRVVNGEWTRLIDWTAAEAIDPAEGETNRLGVLAQGDRFLLLVNDVPLAEATDGAFAGGGVGLYAGVYEEAGLDVTFDNMDVWVLSESAASQQVDTGVIDAAQQRSDEVREGDATYSARFSRDDGAWSLSEDDDASIAVERGSLAIDVHRAQWLAWADNPTEVADFLLEVAVTLDDPTTPGEAGIVFRMVDDDNFYFLAIDNTGRFSLWKKEAGEWLTITPWAKVGALNSEEGVENRIGVLAEGRQVAVLLNGQVVATVDDDSFDAGSLALAAGAFDTPGFGARFDNLSLWNLGE